MKNKLGKRVLTMALAMVLTFASCVTAFAQMGTAGDSFFEYTEYFYASKGSAGDATAPAIVRMTTANNATNFNVNVKEVLAKDYFTKGSQISFENASNASSTELLSINTENLATMVTKEAGISAQTGSKDGWGYLWIHKVTNSDSAFDGKITIGKNDAVTNKLTAAGYTGNSVQFQIAGSGRLPGLANVSIQDYTFSYADEKSSKEGTGYLYYYDIAADSFILVDEAEWYSSNYFNKWTNFRTKNAKAISKGAYVFTTDKIAESATIKNVVVVEGGSWYIPDGVDMTGIDMSFTVGGTPSAELTKKLSSVKLPDTLKYTPVTFKHHGTLPDGVKVKVEKLEGLGVAEGATVFLYCYNPEKNVFEYIDEATYKSGSAIFKLPHCSEFIVTNEKLPTALTSITVKTGDATNAIPFVIALICGCAAIGVVVVRRRTVK